MMEPTPVYICTGFLDSGKTLLVKDTLMEQEWIEPGLTLLILCEEGEEEYSKEYLEENDMVLLKIDKFEQLNATFFTNCEKNYHPAQVVMNTMECGSWKICYSLSTHANGRFREFILLLMERHWICT